jgi:hypothetical protein
MVLLTKQRSKEPTKMNTAPYLVCQMSRVRSRTTGVTPPRLFGKCAGKTLSSLPQSRHKNTRRFTLVQVARGDLT